MKQIVKINTPFGLITLSCDSKFSQNNTTQIDNISLVNVPITYNHTQTIPIIYNKINEFARDSFSTLDKELDIEDVDKLLKAYDIATSNPIRILFILIILVFVAGIILINKPMISGLIPIGIDFIISGVLMSVVYIGGEVMAESLVNELLKKDYQISFGSYLVCGITEIVFGIVLIIGTVILKNKFFNKKEVEIKE